MSTHYIQFDTDIRIYFDVGIRSTVAATTTPEDNDFLVSFEGLNRAFNDDIPIGVEQAAEMNIKIDINKFSGNKGHLFKGYDTVYNLTYGVLPRYNRWWVVKDTGSGYDWGSGSILFEGVQEPRAEEELELGGEESGFIELTATCHIKRFMEWVQMSDLLASHSYGGTPTHGTGTNPSFTTEVREMCWKISTEEYVTRASRYLSGRIANNRSGAILYTMENYLNFIFNSSYENFQSAIDHPFGQWDLVIRGSINDTFTFLHTPLSHWTLYEQNDTGKEYNTVSSGVLAAGSTALNCDEDVYLTVGEIVADDKYPFDVCATGWHGERDAEGNLWDYFVAFCEGFGTKCVFKYESSPKVEFHPILDYMDSSSTFSAKVYKSINTITEWSNPKFTYHAGYISQCEIMVEDVFLKTATRKDNNLSDYVVTKRNHSINSTSFDARMLYNNLLSDIVDETWSGAPFEGIRATYSNSEYKDNDAVIPPNKINKLCSQTTRTLTPTGADNPIVQYLMVHPHCSFTIKDGSTYSATGDVGAFFVRDHKDPNYTVQNAANQQTRETSSMSKCYADAFIDNFGLETRFALELELDDSQIDITQLGEVFEISGGIDQIVEAGASWLSGQLTNELILTEIELTKPSLNDSIIYKCKFTGS